MINTVAWLQKNGEWKKNPEYWVNWGIKTYSELKQQLICIHGSEKKANQYGNGVYWLLDHLKTALLKKQSSYIDPVRYLSFLYFDPKKEFSLRDISKKLEEDFDITISPRSLGQYFTDKFEWELRGKNTSSRKVVAQNRKTNKNNQEKKKNEIQNIIRDIKENRIPIDTFNIEKYLSTTSKLNQIEYLLESYGYIEKDWLEALIERYQSDNYSDRKITAAIDTIIKIIIINNELSISLAFSKHRISEIINN